MHGHVARDDSNIGEADYKDIKGFTVGDYAQCNEAEELCHMGAELLETMNHDPPQSLKCLEQASTILAQLVTKPQFINRQSR